MINTTHGNTSKITLNRVIDVIVPDDFAFIEIHIQQQIHTRTSSQLNYEININPL